MNQSKTITPTQSNSELSTNMDDITYLIHLEAYKRFKDEDTHIRRMVEEKIKQYNEVKSEYLNLYSRYVEVLKLCSTRSALLSENFQDHEIIDLAAKSVDTIAKKTNIDQQVEFLQADVLNRSKEIFTKAPEFKNLEEIHHLTASNKNRVDFIKSSLGRVESKLESSIVSGFDSFIKRIED